MWVKHAVSASPALTIIFFSQKHQLNPDRHINWPRGQVKHLICHPESRADKRMGTRLLPGAHEGGTGRSWCLAAVDTHTRRTEGWRRRPSGIMCECLHLTDTNRCGSLSCRCTDLMWGHGVKQERDEAWWLTRDVWISALCALSINNSRYNIGIIWEWCTVQFNIYRGKFVQYIPYKKIWFTFNSTQNENRE